MAQNRVSRAVMFKRIFLFFNEICACPYSCLEAYFFCRRHFLLVFLALLSGFVSCATAPTRFFRLFLGPMLVYLPPFYMCKKVQKQILRNIGPGLDESQEFDTFFPTPGRPNRGLATLIPSSQNAVTERLPKPAPPQGDQKSVKRSVSIRERIVSCCRGK